MGKDSSLPDFVTFIRDLEGYKWYKPLLTIILAFIFYFILSVIIMFAFDLTPGLNQALLDSTRYETVNATSIEGLSSFLFVVIMIPSVLLASKITHDRPLSTYFSSRGKWSWEVFLKSFLIGAVFIIIVNDIPSLIQGAKLNITFTIVTFILAIILVPLQCFAEELVFRGLFMQSVGAWCKIPILAIIIQAIIFMLVHPYNFIGQISVLVCGLVYGFLSWQMNGLEASSGMHIANNLILFLSMGIISIGPVATEVTISDSLMDIAIMIITAAIILYLDKKTNWLNSDE